MSFRAVPLIVGCLLVAGCQNSLLRPQSPDPEISDDAPGTTIETRLLGDYMSVYGNQPVVLQGIGLVTQLDNSGGDPPPSVSRTALRDDMNRRGVKNPEAILRDSSTAMVVVRAYLPPLVRKGQKLDVEVYLPANSNAKSLRGGWLMETRLTEQAVSGGRILEGREYAVALGPILISASTDGDGETRAGVLKRGKILGGAVSLAERDLTLVLRNDFRSIRNAKRVADRISERFYHYSQHGIRESLADAETDREIELKLHPLYRDNDWRYKQVVSNIAFRETDVAARLRMQKMQKELLNPVTSERASLQLEAIGKSSIPFLKKGLTSANPEVRFHSGVALAYLGDASGVKVLAAAARDEPAFRAYAFAALSVIHDADALVELRKLLDERSAETRYGAFRALTVLDRNDAYIAGEEFADGFHFHVLDTPTEPMIHVTHRRTPEVVLFGKDQTLQTPLALWAGKHIMVRAQPESDTVVVSRYQVGLPDRREEVSTSVEEVIRTAVELGASYPAIAEMLMQADRQGSLPGRLEIDALPQTGRTYYRNKDKTLAGTRLGRADHGPGLFDYVKQPTDSSERSMPRPDIEERGTASIVDARRDRDADAPRLTTSRGWRDRLSSPFKFLSRR